MITNEEFVKMWQRAGSIQDIVDQSGLKYQSAQARAVRMRKYGIPLKKFSNAGPRVFSQDGIARLKKLALAEAK